jgi:hypothetical protein
MASHIQFRIHTPDRKVSKKIERVQDAVCAAKKAGPGARIVTTRGRDVTKLASDKFGSRRCSRR